MVTFTWSELVQQCSGDFLVEPLPLNSDDWNQEELYEFIAENVWKPFEYENPETIYEYIISAAFSLEHFLGKKGCIIQES